MGLFEAVQRQPMEKLSRTHGVNSITKIYPKFTKIIVYDNEATELIPGFDEKNITGLQRKKSELQKKIDAEENKQKAIRRAKSNITDITLANDFDMFATFTFNCKNCPEDCKNYIKGNRCKCSPGKCLRNDAAVQKQRMSSWLKNAKKSNGKFAYLIVAEYHKDGKALHFHALMKGYNGKLNFSGRIKDGRKIYNVPGYRLGFSTIVKIDNIKKVSSYIKKYITKDMITFPGKKRYWCSTGLIRPIKVKNNLELTLGNPYLKGQIKQTFRAPNFTVYEYSGTLQMHNNLIKETLRCQNNQKTQTHRRQSQMTLLLPVTQKRLEEQNSLPGAARKQNVNLRLYK